MSHLELLVAPGPLLAAVLVSAALAGCISGDRSGPDGAAPLPPAERAALFAQMFASDDTHDHAEPREHQLAFNMQLLDHLPLADPGVYSGIHALHIHGDRLYVAAGMSPNPGIIVVDISDPADLRVLGEWHDPAALGGDRAITVSEDGRFAFVANEGEQPGQGGVRMLNVEEPANIEQLTYFPMRPGAHTIETITLDGEVFVFAVNFGVHILRVVDLPVGPALVEVGHYLMPTEAMTQPPPGAVPDELRLWGYRALYGHDMRALVDPEIGPLLFVAYAYQGLHILSIEQPAAPVLLARWTPTGDGAPFYVHGVSVEWIGERRIAVVDSEDWEDRQVDVAGPVWVLDVTDIAAPALLSTWTNPAGAGSQKMLFSPHFQRLVEGRVHLAHYHGGVWVLDISTPERQAAPEVVGGYLPSADTGYRPDPSCCRGFNWNALPLTFDVVAKDGVTYAADFYTGLYALRVVE